MTFWEEIKQSWQKRRAWWLLSLFIFFFSLAGIYYFLFLPDWFSFSSSSLETDFQPVEEILNPEDKQCPDCQARFLDGILVSRDDARPYPVAIVIDNHPDARPALGLDQAALVFEVPTEGGSSRFLAIFNGSELIDQVGPVRSARPYFIDWSLDVGAILIHCGGSPEALARLSQQRILSLNEFYYGRYFQRDSRFLAPHNILITSASWQTFLEEQGRQEAVASAWKFTTNQTVSDQLASENIVNDPTGNPETINNNSREAISELRVRYSQPYQANWLYQPETNNYQRSLDASSSPNSLVWADNLIIHYTDSQVLDRELRLRLQTIGEGEALVCLDGYCQTAIWKKNSLTDRLRYFYLNDEEVVFNPGKTWIQVLAADASLTTN